MAQSMNEFIKGLGGTPPTHQVRQFASENFRLMEVKIPAASLKKVSASGLFGVVG